MLLKVIFTNVSSLLLFFVECNVPCMGIFYDVILFIELVKFIVICNDILPISTEVCILQNQFDIGLLILLMEYFIDITLNGDSCFAYVLLSPQSFNVGKTYIGT